MSSLLMEMFLFSNIDLKSIMESFLNELSQSDVITFCANFKTMNVLSIFLLNTYVNKVFSINIKPEMQLP